jgi:hypothetical protein
MFLIKPSIFLIPYVLINAILLTYRSILHNTSVNNLFILIIELVTSLLHDLKLKNQIQPF